MPDTPRTLAALQALLADNTAGDISAQDIRDFLVSVALITGTGELGGTADAPTVNATHSGSAHHAQSHGNADHTTGVAPADVTKAAAAEGTNAAVARADHKHDVSSAAAGASAFGDSAAEGTATSLARSDHRHSREANPVTAHEAAGDPHTGYRLESADHSHQSTGAQAGQLDHGLALTGLADDDHSAYLLASDATNRATFAANWTDLTDGGASALHSHAGGGAHALLDGSTHNDTLVDTVTDGDVIIGNATPKWSSLAISVPAANVRNVLGVDNGELRPSWKAMLDGTNPADVATSASPGTSLIAAHRDHVHKAAHSGIDTTSMKQSFMLVGWRPTSTTGAAGPLKREIGSTNKKDFDVVEFVSASVTKAYLYHPMPDNWDGSTVTFRVWWLNRTGYVATSSDGVAWTLAGTSYADGDAIDTALGTGVTVTDTTTANNLLNKTADSSALTIGNSPAAGELVHWIIQRETGNAADDLASDDVGLVAVVVEYGVSALSS